MIGASLSSISLLLASVSSPLFHRSRVGATLRLITPPALHQLVMRLPSELYRETFFASKKPFLIREACEGHTITTVLFFFTPTNKITNQPSGHVRALLINTLFQHFRFRVTEFVHCDY